MPKLCLFLLLSPYERLVKVELDVITFTWLCCKFLLLRLLLVFAFFFSFRLGIDIVQDDLSFNDTCAITVLILFTNGIQLGLDKGLFSTIFFLMTQELDIWLFDEILEDCRVDSLNGFHQDHLLIAGCRFYDTLLVVNLDFEAFNLLRILLPWLHELERTIDFISELKLEEFLVLRAFLVDPCASHFSQTRID